MAVTEAKDAVKGEFYVRTKNRFALPTYYEVPSLTRKTYEARLRKKYATNSLLCGQESTNLQLLSKNPDAVLLRRVVRYRGTDNKPKEEATLVVVDPHMRLRAVKQKPRRKKR